MTQIAKMKINCYKKLTNLQQSDNDSHLSQSWQTKDEFLAIEMPVALVYNGISHTVMMCTPTDLEDFAYGFSLTENIIDKAADIYGIDVIKGCSGIELHIELATRCFVRLKQLRRTLTGRTGCGICGAEQLEQVTKKIATLDHNLQFNLNLLDHCLYKMQQAQQLAQQTGATHAAAFFNTEGQLLSIREDVGRHVALDKLLGWYANANQPAGFVMVTSRASYEMVQKVASCQIEMLVAMSASTQLAVQTAIDTNLTLIGFARQGRANIYYGEHRLTLA